MLLVSLYVLFWPDPAGSSGPPGADKVVHAVLFGLLAVTARGRFGGRRTVLALLVGYAPVSELVQDSVLTTRSGDPWDVVADLVGVGVGWWLAGRAARDQPPGPGRLDRLPA